MDKVLNKPVCILLNGTSLQILEDNIEHFKDFDVIWCGLNRFKYIEDHILQKIDKKFDWVYCSSEERWNEIEKDLKDVEIITNTEITYRNPEMTPIYISDFAYGFNSLWALLCVLIRLGHKNIYLFGCDGAVWNHKRKLDTQVYYRQNEIKDDFNARLLSISKDTEILNDMFKRLMDYWGISLRDVNIKNVNKESKVKCFEKVSINQAIKELENV